MIKHSPTHTLESLHIKLISDQNKVNHISVLEEGVCNTHLPLNIKVNNPFVILILSIYLKPSFPLLSHSYTNAPVQVTHDHHTIPFSISSTTCPNSFQKLFFINLISGFIRNPPHSFTLANFSFTFIILEFTHLNQIIALYCSSHNSRSTLSLQRPPLFIPNRTPCIPFHTNSVTF